MRQIEKTYKKGVFRKLLIRLCRKLGYELIDQADMSFATSLNKESASIIGKKSIVLYGKALSYEHHFFGP